MAAILFLYKLSAACKFACGICQVHATRSCFATPRGEPVLRIQTRIRMRIQLGRLDPDPLWESGSRRAKMTHKSEENTSFKC
jgi:hypothetical protein